MRVPERRCPHCDARLDSAERPSGDDPSPGDVSVCFYCARLLLFAEDMSIEKLPHGHPAHTDPEVRRVVSLVKEHGPRTPGGSS